MIGEPAGKLSLRTRFEFGGGRSRLVPYHELLCFFSGHPRWYEGVIRQEEDRFHAVLIPNTSVPPTMQFPKTVRLNATPELVRFWAGVCAEYQPVPDGAAVLVPMVVVAMALDLATESTPELAAALATPGGAPA